MSKKRIVSVALGIVLLQASPAALPIPCVICIGDEPEQICIPPGCTPPPLVPFGGLPGPWLSSGPLADRPGNGGPGR